MMGSARLMSPSGIVVFINAPLHSSTRQREGIGAIRCLDHINPRITSSACASLSSTSRICGGFAGGSSMEIPLLLHCSYLYRPLDASPAPGSVNRNLAPFPGPSDSARIPPPWPGIIRFAGSEISGLRSSKHPITRGVIPRLLVRAEFFVKLFMVDR